MRRDLRLADNRALQSAIEHANSTDCVAVAFVFDQNILERLEDKADCRVAFLHRELQAIHKELQTLGGQLMVGFGDPKEVWAGWIETWKAQDIELKSVHVGRDYEPYAQQRDRSMADFFTSHGVAFKGVNVLEDDGLRDGIKTYSNWPTIPQLYVKGEFVGGCDIIREMFEEGELRPYLAEKGISLLSAAE